MKRSKMRCPNPLFEQWLEEWRQEAAEKNHELQYSFGKALTSLRKYPLPLASGKECAILQYFGQKICNMLDKKLEKYRKLHNMPSTSAQNHFPFDLDIGLKRQKKVRERKEPENKKVEPMRNVRNYQITPNNKSYVPTIRSAPYAILITMYNKMQEENYPGFMFKKDIMKEAQENCDCPMKGTASNYYAGWSSMSTLIQKNLVVKKSSPAKYILTDAGIALALALLDGSAKHFSNSDDDAEPCNNLNDQKSNETRPQFKSKSSGSMSSDKKYNNFNYNLEDSPVHLDLLENNLSPFKEKPTISRNFNDFMVIDDDEDDEVFKYDNVLKTDTLDYFEAEEKKATETKSNNLKDDLTSSKSKSSSFNDINDLIIIDDDEDDEVFNFNNKIKTDNIQVDNFKKKKVEELYAIETKFTVSSDDDFSQFCKENAEPVVTVRKKQPHFIFTETLTCPTTSTESNKKDQIGTQKVLNEIELESTVKIKKTDDEKKGKGNREVTQDVNVTNSKKKTASFTDTPTDSFFLLPNNFDIILLVDTQETSGGKTRPKDDPTISELTKAGVLFEVRSLNVGDFTWIARCRFSNKELVLPYIIERKRIDDLSSSIKDGRYHEQKFRLRRSGIKNVIYMIEKYDMKHFGSIPLTSLLQAAVNSLVQDEFLVKFTKDLRDSIRYLATLTNMLTKNYESKELTSCRKADLESKDFNTIESSELLMEFTEFNKASIKTKNFKVREMLIRQLLQLKGLSVEKAMAIVELYPTPKILAEALQTSDDKLLANIQTGPSKRKIGPTLSKTIYQLYTNRSLT